MHNSTTRKTASEDRDRFNANLFEQSLSSQIYNRWVSVKEWDNVSGATTTAPTNDVFASHIFGDAGRASVGAYVPKNRDWRKGIVTIVPHIQMQAATGNVKLYCALYALKQGDNLTAWPTTGTAQDKTIAAQAGAYDLYVVPESIYLSDAVWSVAVDDSTVALQVVVGRNGADAGDTMTGNVHFLGAMLKYIEGEKAIGELYDPIRR